MAEVLQSQLETRQQLESLMAAVTAQKSAPVTTATGRLLEGLGEVFADNNAGEFMRMIVFSMPTSAPPTTTSWCGHGRLAGHQEGRSRVGERRLPR